MLKVPNSEKWPLSKPSRKWHAPGPGVLDGVPVAAREIPGVAFFEIVHFGLAVGRDDGGAAAARQHVGPFGGQRMPMQFADGAGSSRMETPAILCETGNCFTVASLAEPPGPTQPFSLSMSYLNGSSSSALVSSDGAAFTCSAIAAVAARPSETCDRA